MNALAAEALSVQQLRPHPKNVRRDVVPSEELVASVKAHGILQPLLVIPHPVLDGDYLVVAGHHRLAAAKKAGLLTVPCMVNTTLGDEAEQLAVMLVENLQRTDLTVGEEAKAYQQLLAFDGWTEARIAKRTGRAKDTVRGRVKLAAMGDAAIGAVEERRATLEDVLKLADAGLPEEKQAEALSGTRVDSWGIQRAVVAWEKEQAAPALAEKLRGEGFTVVASDALPEGLTRIWYPQPSDFDRYTDIHVVIDEASGWEAAYFGHYEQTTKAGKQAPRELTEEQEAAAARRTELEAGLQIARRVHEETIRKTIRTEKTIENGRARDALMDQIARTSLWQLRSLAFWLEVDEPDDGDAFKEAVTAAASKLTLAGLVLAWYAAEKLQQGLEELEDLDSWDHPRQYTIGTLAVLGSELSDVEREAIAYWQTCSDCKEDSSDDEDEEFDDDDAA